MSYGIGGYFGLHSVARGGCLEFLVFVHSRLRFCLLSFVYSRFWFGASGVCLFSVCFWWV